MVHRFEARVYWICGGFEPRRSRHFSFAGQVKTVSCPGEEQSLLILFVRCFRFGSAQMRF